MINHRKSISQIKHLASIEKKLLVNEAMVHVKNENYYKALYLYNKVSFWVSLKIWIVNNKLSLIWKYNNKINSWYENHIYNTLKCIIICKCTLVIFKLFYVANNNNNAHDEKPRKMLKYNKQNNNLVQLLKHLF